jgi:hypothetical protein
MGVMSSPMGEDLVLFVEGELDNNVCSLLGTELREQLEAA